MQISKQFDEEENEQYAAAGFELLKLTDWQKRTLKIADTMDLLLFCVRELNLGNSDMDVVYQRGVGYIRELEPLSNIELELLTIIGERYAGISKR
jgi:hypothetical protein